MSETEKPNPEVVESEFRAAMIENLGNVFGEALDAVGATTEDPKSARLADIFGRVITPEVLQSLAEKSLANKNPNSPASATAAVAS